MVIQLIIRFLPRCQDVKTRKEYVNIVDTVRDSGGDVKIFSSMHVSGERKYTIKKIKFILRLFDAVYNFL